MFHHRINKRDVRERNKLIREICEQSENDVREFFRKHGQEIEQQVREYFKGRKHAR